MTNGSKKFFDVKIIRIIVSKKENKGEKKRVGERELYVLKVLYKII